jgi:hypothetical protein
LSNQESEMEIDLIDIYFCFVFVSLGPAILGQGLFYFCLSPQIRITLFFLDCISITSGTFNSNIKLEGGYMLESP